MANSFKNFCLGLKYKLWKENQKKVDFGTPTFTEDFHNPGYLVLDRNPYNDDMITLKENVQVIDGKLLLHAKYENRDFSSWWGTAKKIWSIGYIEYVNHAFPFGIWTVKCRLPDDKDAWPAIWLLRKRHPEHETKIDLGNAQREENNQLFLPEWTNQRVDLNWYIWYDQEIVGFISGLDKPGKKITVDNPIPEPEGRRIYVSPDHITPEVDFMEIIRGKIQHTIHYGYSNQVYRTQAWKAKRGKPDIKKEYEFAVELSTAGYKFYIDRVLTAVFRDKKAITSAGAYLIINNAKHRRVTSGENSVFEISEVKFYGKPL
ncbi:MAG TPA: hypothetical protein DCR40_16080 [Prolixibacteraceae bacterium]|nr:hypothetical protein [Prolixibacteraceae bacterium]